MRAAELHLINGEKVDIEISDEYSVSPESYTERFIHRFPTKDGVVFVLGARINFVRIFKGDS